MYGATPNFFATLAESHFVVAEAHLLIEGAPAANLSDLGIVVDGSVQVQNAAEQRNGSLTVADEDGALTPTDVDDILAPLGNEIRLWRGVGFNDPLPDTPTEELVPIGTLRFTSTKTKRPEIGLDLHDRSWVVAGNHLETPLNIAKGTNYITAIEDLLQTAWGGGLPTNFPNTDEVTPSLAFDADTDPWEAARGLAANLGMRLFFDVLGVATLMPEPNGRGNPVWIYDDADVKNLGLYGAEQTWDASNAVNAVIAVGENSDNAQVWRGIARDTDPHSPTQYGGKFGRRPVILRDEKITSQAQADQRAKKELLQRLGIMQTVSVPSLVNPALECGDLVRVQDRRTGIDQRVIVDRFTVPLRASATTVLERTRLMPLEVA